MKTKLSISWMHCSSCSKLIETTLNKNEFIKEANVNFWNNKALIDFDETKISENEIIFLIKRSWYDARKEEEKKIDESQIWAKKSLFWFFLSLPLLVFMIYDFIPTLPYSALIMSYMAIISFGIATLIQFTLWIAFYKWAFAALRQKSSNMFTLIAIGTSVAYFYSLYSFLNFYFETGSILWMNGMKIEWIYFEVSALLITFVCFWKWLETRAKSKTSQAISKLMSLTPKKAIAKIWGEFIEIDIEKIKVWYTIFIKPGDKIPVDGKIISWTATIDESMLTWESMPIDKNIGDKVMAWTLNSLTSFEMKATQVWAWTLLSQIITLLEEASIQKSEIENFADSISKVFVPVVIILSILTFLSWYFIIGSSFENALLLACSVIVIACPCALGLATPTAVIVWTWLAAKSWILIKWWTALEKLSSINAIALDKTGTITIWNPKIQDIKIFSQIWERASLEIASSLENHSHHPLAKAFSEYRKEKNLSLLEVKNFEDKTGKWIIGEISWEKYFIGNKTGIDEFFMEKKSFHQEIESFYTKLLDEWKTVLFLANTSEIIAVFALSDSVKTTSQKAIQTLQNMGIEVFMITGDNEKSALFIASQVGIKKENIFAWVLPQKKWEIVKEIQKKWYCIAMVWDGINDSIAMTNAHVGISMGNGNDIALESAEVVLIKNDLQDVISSIEISKNTVNKIKQNLFFSLFYNSLGIPIAAWVFLWIWLFLKPEFAWLAMALSSVSVVLNSLLLKVKMKHFGNISLLILLWIFTSIFIWFASINATDTFTKSYTKNNNEILISISDFITESPNKINITENAPKIFLFTENIPKNIKLKNGGNTLDENSLIIGSMEAQMMIKEWLITWVWDTLDNFFWLEKVVITGILEKTDTALDEVHILSSKNYEKIIWDSESLVYLATPDKLWIRTFYLYTENNIPKVFQKDIDINNSFSWEYLHMYIWFLDAKMMKDLWTLKNIWDTLENFFGNKVIYIKKLKRTYSAYDMMHFIDKNYFKIWE